jgi:hypothetical protein
MQHVNGVASLFHTGNTDTLEKNDFACFHTIVKYAVSLDVIFLTVKKDTYSRNENC